MIEELLDVFSYAGEVGFHFFGIFLLDNFEESRKLLLDLPHLVGGIGVEENFGEQEIIFREESAGNVHVLFEGRTGGILMLHDRGEYQCRGERYRKRVGDGLVVLLERVFKDVQS